MLHWLNDYAFTFPGGEQTSWAELLGFVTGIACVWLVVRQHIANWPVGILNVVLLMVAFVDAGIYADAGLQVVYVVLGFYGWWEWHTRGDARELPVRTTKRVEWWGLAIGGVAATVVLYVLLRTVVPSSTVPAGDAVTTALSLVATYGQCRKLVESWWFWIVADIVYLPLYAYKHLYLTTALYAVFLGLAVIGLRSWLADLRGGRAVDAPAVAVVG